MKIAVAVWLIAVLAAAPAAARQPGVSDDAGTVPALFPLFVSCDLVAQFVTPGIDEGEQVRLESPVSLEGARMLEASRQRYAVAAVPLLLEQVDAGSVGSKPAARFDARRDNARVRLMSTNVHELYAPAKAALPARTGPSTWVRIRALFGR